MTLGDRLLTAEAEAGRVRLIVATDRGERTLTAEHVMAATGYRPDLRRIGFLDPALLGAARTAAKAPVLSSRLESSVSRLFFIGPVAADSFGPLMRFGFGARFTAPTVAPALSGKRRSVRLSGTRPQPEGIPATR